MLRIYRNLLRFWNLIDYGSSVQITHILAYSRYAYTLESKIEIIYLPIEDINGMKLLTNWWVEFFNWWNWKYIDKIEFIWNLAQAILDFKAITVILCDSAKVLKKSVELLKED